MPKPPKAESNSPSPPRRRRWPRRLAVTGLVLAVLALVLDGPGGRWIIKSVLISQLEKQGLSGDLELSGHLHSGYQLTNAGFTGTGPIRVLSFDALGLAYSLPKLLDKQVDALSGRNINVVLHPEPKPEEEDPETPFSLDLPEDTIQMIRGFVLPVTLDFQNVSLEIQRDDAEPLTASLASLSHRSGDDTIRLTGLTSNALGDDGLPSQDIEINWAADAIALSGVQVLPSIKVNGLELGLPAGQPATANGGLTLVGAAVDFAADETGSAKLTLKDQSLDLQEIIKQLPLEQALDVTGKLNTLVVDVENLLAPPAEWRGGVQLAASDLQYEAFQLDALAINGTISPDGIALVTTLGPDGATALKINTTLPEGEGQSLLADHPYDFNLELRSIDSSLAWILDGLAKDPSQEPPELPSGSFSLSGRVVLDTDGKPSTVAASFHTGDLAYQGKPVPPLKGSAKLAGQLAEVALGLAKPAEGESVDLSASARLDAGTYEGRTGITLPDPAWVNALIPGDSPLWKPSGPVRIQWEGAGSYKEMTHNGSAAVEELKLTAPQETLTSINTRLSYGWPGSVTLESLDVRNGDLKVSGTLAWKDGILNIPGIETADQSGVLMKLSGNAPLAESLRSLQDLLDADQEFDLAFEADRFELSRLEPLLPVQIPEGYAAGFQSKLKLTGTAAHPRIDGQLQVFDIRVPKPEGLPPEQAVIELSTTNDTLSLRGTISDPDGEVIKLEAEAPLKVRDWATDPRSLRDATFRSRAVSEAFDFARLEKFVPQLAGAKGSIGIDVVAQGTVSKPDLTGNIAVAVENVPLDNTPYRQVDSARLLLRFEGRRFFLDPSQIEIAGGKIILTGDASIEGEEPAFNLNVKTEQALLWRDDGYSARADAQLTLAGTPKAAKVTGSVDIVESLVYKDIEIIPIGVPTTSVPKPSLPKIDKESTGGPLVPAPAPFSDWTLDVKIRTGDPILIRGNLATGEIRVNAAVGGTVSSPEPAGTIELRDVSADLPFSTLKVKRGQIVLRPKAPLNPTLDIRGTSSINRRQVAMLVFGPLNNPKYTLSSDPPLPENEILTLIATGSTTEDLEDTNTASMKAFQLMIEELRRRSSQPGGNAAFKRILQELEDVELNVGENDPFTGRKFSSATLQLADKYYLSAGFDTEGNTRTSIIYSLRFR